MNLADFIEQNGFEKGMQQAEQNFKIIATQLRQESIQEGISLGKQEGLYQTAERLLTETDFDDDKISQLTNLTVIEIKKLREKKKQSH